MGLANHAHTEQSCLLGAIITRARMRVRRNRGGSRPPRPATHASSPYATNAYVYARSGTRLLQTKPLNNESLPFFLLLV